MRYGKLTLSALFVLAASSVQAQNLLVNGDFEDPILSPGAATLYNGGQVIGAGGWTTVGVQVGLIQTAYGEPFNGITAFQAEHGLNSLDLTGSNNTGPTSGVQQTVATIIGQTYDLSFFVGTADGNAPDYAGPATVNLSIDGGAPVAYTNTNLSANPGFVDWEQFTTSFVATQANTTLTFLNGTPIQTDEGGLDNIVFTGAVPPSVPEPSAIALFLSMTLTGASFLARHRKCHHKAV